MGFDNFSHHFDTSAPSGGTYNNSELKDMTPPSGSYDYPDGRDWRPGTPLHEAMLEILGDCIYDSWNEMQERHDTMREMDSVMTAYIPLDSYEKAIKGSDPRKPVAIQVPVTYGVHQTIHTNYLSLLSANEGIDRFVARSPEDAIGAALAEEVLQGHSQHFGELLAHSVQASDFLKYGFGAITPCWTQEWEYEELYIESEDPSIEPYVERIPKLAYEGNRVDNIDPYLFYPDPNVEITQVEKMEYLGYDSRTNLHRILTREDQENYGFFNAGYVQLLLEEDTALTNPRIIRIDQGHENAASNRTREDIRNKREGNKVHETFIFKWIIPSMVTYKDERGNVKRLGDSNSPELWTYVVAGDRIILHAQPIAFLHNRIPVTVAAPESDGYGTSPMAHLEMTRGLQDTINFRVNAENAFFRRFYKGRFIGDPDAVDIRALLTGADFVPVSRLGSRGKSLDQILQSVDVIDPFRGSNAGTIAQMQDLLYRASGATDTLQGVMQTRGERRSATEAQGARMGALNRIEKMLLIASIQSMNKLSYLKLRQVQQFMTDDTYVRMIGRNQDLLMEEYGKVKDERGWAQDDRGFFPVDPRDLDVAFDVAPLDVTRRAEEFANQHLTLFQSLMQNPEAVQGMDLWRYWKHLARILGFKNVDDFKKQTGGVTTELQDPAQLQQQAQAGNALPLNASQPIGV
jgi:hypothetical protein